MFTTQLKSLIYSTNIQANNKHNQAVLILDYGTVMSL